MAWEETAAADAVFGIAGQRGCALDELDAGPKTTGVLPTAAGAADPFAEDGAGGDDAALGFVARAGERADLAGGAHANPDERAEEIGGDGEARTLGDPVDVGNEFEAATGAKNGGEKFGQAGAGAFNAGWNQTGGDDGGF